MHVLYLWYFWLINIHMFHIFYINKYKYKKMPIEEITSNVCNSGLALYCPDTAKPFISHIFAMGKESSFTPLGTNLPLTLAGTSYKFTLPDDIAYASYLFDTSGQGLYINIGNITYNHACNNLFKLRLCVNVKYNVDCSQCQREFTAYWVKDGQPQVKFACLQQQAYNIINTGIVVTHIEFVFEKAFYLIENATIDVAISIATKDMLGVLIEPDSFEWNYEIAPCF